MKRQTYYTAILVTITVILAAVFGLSYTNEKLASRVATSPSKPGSATPTMVLKNPMSFLPSKAVHDFFATKPSQAILNAYKTQVAKLPLLTGSITLHGCDASPAIVVVPQGATVTFQNTDKLPHTLTLNGQSVTLSTSGSGTLKNTASKGDFKTYGCDGTQNVGVLYAK